MSDAATLAIVARRLNRARGADAKLRPLLFLTDERRTRDPAARVEAWPASLARVTAVVFRHYDDPDRRALAHRLAKLCRARGVPLLIGADPALALEVRAAGVHWPDGLLRRRGRADKRHPDWIVTAAAHDGAGLQRAARAGVDAVLLSPVFATESHEGVPELGAVRFARLVRSSASPVYALGGLDGTAARHLLGSGAVGVAAIGGFRNPAPSR